ncbi:MAG: GNAT family N-acetyltransferase [Thermomicrobiales bacterium]|jgi:GNAT superfamily N-acetyltransferase|nr:GNAT family N-acetyltransferase [Thermomicrobiales bacterium]
MTSVRIATELTGAEIDRLGEILVAIVDDGASVGYLPPLEPAKATAYWRGVCKPEVILFLAEVDGEIAGTVQLELAAKANARHRAEVNRLLVDPAYQRRGIGRVLMEALEVEARVLGRTLLHLDTREGDTSNDFYRSQGWTEAGTIPMWARSSGGSLDGTVFYYKVLE